MNENFEKFKKKILKEHLIKSIIYGCSASASLVSCASILFKLISVHIHFVIYIVFSGLLAILFAYLINKKFKPSDESIAKRIDKQFSLNEQVQTMIQYKDQDELLINKQREHTENELKNISVKKLPMKFAFVMFFAIILSLGICTSSIFVKERRRPTNSSSEISSIVSSEIISSSSTSSSSSSISDKDIIDQLIEAVSNSSLDEKTKQEIIDELTILKDQLITSSEEERSGVIKQCKDKIDQLLEKELSKNKIGAELKKSSIAILQNIGEALINNDTTLLTNAFTTFNNSLSSLDLEQIQNQLSLYHQEINLALTNSKVDSTDELYICFQSFSNTLLEIKNQLELSTSDIQIAKENIISLSNETLNKILEILTKQQEIEELKKLIDEVLDALANPSGEGDPSEDGDPSQEQGSTDEDGDGNTDKPGDNTGDENDNPQGGNGEGEEVYGNNDQVYTKDGNTTEYGDVIDDYYSDIVNGNDEDIPKDIEDILNDYFNSLYGDDGDDEGK